MTFWPAQPHQSGPTLRWVPLLLSRRLRHQRYWLRGAAGFVDPEEYFDPLEFLAELEARESIVVEHHETPIVRAPRQATRA